MADGSLHPDADALRQRGLSSLVLAIELFNRPFDHGRPEAVLILLHHSFEMLLKAMIVAKNSKPCIDDRGYSHSFEQCLQIAHESDKVITLDQRRFLSMLDNLRDSAQHYYQVISEDLLYLFAQGGVSLFACLLKAAFQGDLRDHVPERVLPVFCRPPKNVQKLIADEFELLQGALKEASISREQAVAALRPLVAFAIGGAEVPRRMGTADVNLAIERLEKGEEWGVVFPEVARIQLQSEEGQLGFGIRIVRGDPSAIPVRVVQDGEEQPDGFIVAKEINVFDKFTMGLWDLSRHLGLTPPKALVLAHKYKVPADSAAYREITVGSQTYKRYSKRALDILRPHVAEAEEAWQQTKALKKQARKKTF